MRATGASPPAMNGELLGFTLVYMWSTSFGFRSGGGLLVIWPVAARLHACLSVFSVGAGLLARAHAMPIACSSWRGRGRGRILMSCAASLDGPRQTQEKLNLSALFRGHERALGLGRFGRVARIAIDEGRRRPARPPRARAAPSRRDRARARRPGRCCAASPVIANAWQRQPPKSISRKAQERHGSFIQSVPRKALKASEFSQMSSSGRSRTLSNSRS